MQSNWAPAHSQALCEYLPRACPIRPSRTPSTRHSTRPIPVTPCSAAPREWGSPRRPAADGTKSPSIIAKSPSITETSRILRIRERADSKPWRLPAGLRSHRDRPAPLRRCCPAPSVASDLKRGDCRYPYGGDADGEANHLLWSSAASGFPAIAPRILNSASVPARRRKGPPVGSC